MNAAENYIWARIDEMTTPSLRDLTETPFGAAGRPPVGGVITPAEAPAQASTTPSTMLTILTAVVAAVIAAMVAKRRISK